jgi:hypothetical protein
MNTRICVLKAAIACAVALTSGQAQADIIKHFVRLGGIPVDYATEVPLTTSGAKIVTFSGSGKFTFWFTAECAASGYVDVDFKVDGIPVEPTGGNLDDRFCDADTRGAMHTVTGRTGSLVAGTHTIQVKAYKNVGIAYLSDSSLLIGK